MSILKNHNTQALSDWSGDIASLVREMKRRAGVRTDQELARFIGAAQSTVANWKQRGAVPEAALLKFEEILARNASSPSLRSLYARAVAMRVPEVWYKKISKDALASRQIPYLTAAMSFNALVGIISDNIRKIEKNNLENMQDVAERMLADERYLAQIADWLKSASSAELILREQQAIEQVTSQGLDQ